VRGGVFMSEYSVLDHEMVPKHEVMDESEVKSLLNRYKISLEDLPKIKASDPVVVAIGAKVGDVLKITRKSPTGGMALYYRLVIED